MGSAWNQRLLSGDDQEGIEVPEETEIVQGCREVQGPYRAQRPHRSPFRTPSDPSRQSHLTAPDGAASALAAAKLRPLLAQPVTSSKARPQQSYGAVSQ